MNSGDGKHSALEGRAVLIVEDEAMVAMMLEDLLQELGCHLIGVASRVETALRKIGTQAFDFAILDINLNGEPSYPVADALASRKLPFLFATGYGKAAIPRKYLDHPVVEKPFRKQELEEALDQLVRTREMGG